MSTQTTESIDSNSTSKSSIESTGTEGSTDSEHSIHSFVSKMSTGESVASSAITENSRTSAQSSGQNSDSSKKPPVVTNGVSFARNKEVRMYAVKDKSLDKKIPRKKKKKDLAKMHEQFKTMLTQCSNLCTEEKNNLKKIWTVSISKSKKKKKTPKSPSLGKAES